MPSSITKSHLKPDGEEDFGGVYLRSFNSNNAVYFYTHAESKQGNVRSQSGICVCLPFYE
jgi:hypothetical protein